MQGFTEDKITKNAGQRSFIGKKADQTMIMGTVSGVTINELADIALKLGLTDAMNLDGGASSSLGYPR
ncbi:phosphodiester glycosidase family protein [Ammoniphilus resinae]|uniref:Exopolysaccharide biosynthesis protein n=1 Tax=Ammoniphilus resinae TaxID=861532 RepID=A0ABS4GKW2_9BACL|nr:phosphodiester glycosidase family protein [Ammoniphilus resinae]MBP1930908.1 exopolysaccharide biosynthesis protein [Ammoniphilus resinae]